MKKLLLFLILVNGACFAQNSQELLLQWDLELSWGGYNPGITYYGNSAGSLAAGNVTTSSSVTMGIDNDGFLSSGWSNNPNTPDFTKYYQFTITPQQGQVLEPSLFKFQQNGHCKKFHVRYSTDPSFPNNGILLLYENNAHNNQNEYFDVEFPEGVSVASGQTLYIRIYGYHKQQGNTWRIKSYWNSNWNIFAENDAPQLYGVVSSSLIANDDVATTVQNHPVNINVVANDTAMGTLINGISILSQPFNGTAVVQPDKTILYTPAPGYIGTTTFEYKITSANGAASTGMVTVNVMTMVASTANNDEVTMLKNTTGSFEVLNNDTAGSGAISMITVSNPPDHGVAVVTGNVIHYSPEYNYTGPDNFTYIITDVYNNTSQAIVNITVSAPVLPSGGENTGIYCSSSTTWNGTSWSNGVPTADKDAIISGDYIQSGGNFTACSLFVTGTAQVVFEEESNAYITNNLVIAETASLTFKSSCNLVQESTMPNEGNVTFHRLGSKLKRHDYSFWTSPVTGTQTLQEFSPQTLSNRFYTYTTQNNDFAVAVTDGAFAKAKSYLIRMPDVIFGSQAEAYEAGGYRFPFEGVFTGVPNNGDVTIPLEYYDDINSINGVGNPYPSPISITDFIDANIDNIEGTIWVWRKTNNPGETSYCTITKLGYIANNAPGGGGAAGDDGNTLIADPFTIDDEGVLNTGQGFLVKAKNNENLIFSNSMRKTNNYENFFRNNTSLQTPPSGSAVVASRIWLNATNANATVFSQTLIGYTDGATTGYDNGLDAKSSLAGAVCIYSVIDGAQLAIQGRPAFTVEDVVPLGFKVSTPGEYKIKIDHVNGLFSGEQAIFLKDNETGVIQNISNDEYLFSCEAGIFEDRFEIVYLNEAELSQEVKPVVKDSIIYSEGQKVKIKSTNEINSVTVYDTLGRAIYNESNIMDTLFKSPDLSAQQQVVIVKVTFTDMKEVTQKVLLSK